MKFFQVATITISIFISSCFLHLNAIQRLSINLEQTGTFNVDLNRDYGFLHIFGDQISENSRAFCSEVFSADFIKTTNKIWISKNFFNNECFFIILDEIVEKEKKGSVHVIRLFEFNVNTRQISFWLTNYAIPGDFDIQCASVSRESMIILANDRSENFEINIRDYHYATSIKVDLGNVIRYKFYKERTDIF